MAAAAAVELIMVRMDGAGGRAGGPGGLEAVLVVGGLRPRMPEKPVWVSGANHSATGTEAEKEKLRRQSRTSHEYRRPRASAASAP